MFFELSLTEIDYLSGSRVAWIKNPEQLLTKSFKLISELSSDLHGQALNGEGGCSR